MKLLSNDFEKDFPVLIKCHYLDNAATSLKPLKVIDAVNTYYTEYPANVHRGVYKMSERATDAYESSRENIASLFNAKPDEVIFTRNTTEGINQLSTALSHSSLCKGDTVLITQMEHHSNIVPWLMAKQRFGINVEYIKLCGKELDYDDAEAKIHSLKPKVVSFVHASNVLGTINNPKPIIDLCRDLGIITILDCAQSAPHIEIDFQKLGADFICISAHKMLGPTGIGAVIGRPERIESLPPFFGGGSMVGSVSEQEFSCAEVPQKFEAGTQHIAGAIGFGAAVDYLKKVTFERIHSTENDLLKYILKRYSEETSDFITVHSNTDLQNSLAIFAFSMQGVHPHDIASILDSSNICVRGGHHCAQPLHNILGVHATARASCYFYNTKHDVDALFEGLANVKKVFSL